MIIPKYTPNDWYWKVLGGGLYSSKTASFIEETSEDYLTWSQTKFATIIASTEDLKEVLKKQFPAGIGPELGSIVPQVVSMRQARMALLEANLLSAIETVLNNLSEPTKSQAKIAWEYSQEVQRSFGLVPTMATALGLSPTQIDALFIRAAQL